MTTNEFVERLIKVRAINKPLDRNSELWEWCRSFEDQVSICESNLEQMCLNSLSHGFSPGGSDAANKQSLLRLAEGVGISGVTNPEGAKYIEPQINCNSISESQILGKIERAIGFEIKLPKFIGGRDVTQTERGVFTDRHCHAIWIAKTVTRLFPDRSINIAEVGAGMGILAAILYEIGYRNYTTFDLSNTNTAQAYFLHRNFPDAKIALSGESESPFTKQEGFKLLHASEFKGVPRGTFDVLINCDSLTEMIYEDAVEYVNSPASKSLLSVNHEQNDFRVVDIVVQKKPQWRYPFWIRNGYVEEFFHE